MTYNGYITPILLIVLYGPVVLCSSYIPLSWPSLDYSHWGWTVVIPLSVGSHQILQLLTNRNSWKCKLYCCWPDVSYVFIWYYSSESAYDAVQVILILFSIYGFIFFDLLYIAVIINYCSQCQLLTFFIENLQDKVRNKKYPNLGLAIKVCL